MEPNELKKIIEQVVLRLQSDEGPPCGIGKGQEGIPLEVSGRHVHLTREAVETLFGPGSRLDAKRPLSQPGQFLSEQRVKLVTQKGSLENVAVLGPERSKIQCELSRSDCRELGIQAPVNLSGDLAGAGDVVLVGPAGVVEARGSVIVAKAHIHLTPDQAATHRLQNDQRVSVRICSSRPVVLEDVVVRVSREYAPAMHIDHDEANACSFQEGAAIQVLAQAQASPCKPPGSVTLASKCKGQAVPETDLPKGVVTEALARSIVRDRATKELCFCKGTILTPSAKDVFLHADRTVKYV